MRVTKHEHAALLVEDSGKALIVDPGSFTTPFLDVQNVVGIIITHEHPDHWTPENLDRILKGTGGVPIYGPEGLANAAAGYDVIAVRPGDTVKLDPFTLRFFGGTHAVIHESIPVVDNVGVLVNGTFYYPGDSFVVPKGIDVSLLAAPIGAPWLKVSEAIDFILAVKPRLAFGTHDMTLSVIGRNMHRERLKWATERNDGEFLALDPNESVDI